MEDTTEYKLMKTEQGNGGVFFKTEFFTNTKDTSRTYVKVYSYTQKIAAIQFYKGNKKDGPTLTFNENGTRQLGTYYRNDTVVDMRPFK